MSLDFGEGVDKVRIRVLSENSIDVSLRTDEKFKDKVQQAGLSAYMCMNIRNMLKNQGKLQVIRNLLTNIYYFSLMEWLWSKSDYYFSEDISKKIDMAFDGIGS